MAEEIDSYTGEPWKEEYTSKIPNIQKGRQTFYKERERLRISKQYWVSPLVEGWHVRRVGCPATLFPVLPTQPAAVRAMDWMVRNDASVEIVIHWLAKGNLEPFFKLLDQIMEAANEQ